MVEELRSQFIGEPLKLKWWLRDVGIEVEENIGGMSNDDIKHFFELLKEDTVRDFLATMIGMDKQSLIGYLIELSKIGENESYFIAKIPTGLEEEEDDEDSLSQEDSI